MKHQGKTVLILSAIILSAAVGAAGCTSKSAAEVTAGNEASAETPKVSAEPETTAASETTAESETTTEPETTAEPETTTEPEMAAEPDTTALPETDTALNEEAGGDKVEPEAADSASSEWEHYLGVYSLWNADSPGYQMILMDISNQQISGMYFQIFDNEAHEGRYAEFDVPLSNHQFTISGNTVSLQTEAYEIIGWNGITGNFTSQYELSYIDGADAILDEDYPSSGAYLRKVGDLSSDAASAFWDLYYKINGQP